jgi:quercetin dioxygenase-like cupin family protein
MIKGPINKENVDKIKALEGIYRKTLAYNDDVMLCYFILNQGAEILLHNHESHQVGYVLKGKLKFILENREFIATQGDSYVFDAWEKHGAQILKDSEVIEILNQTRDDYK